jgi:hypothetical protein
VFVVDRVCCYRDLTTIVELVELAVIVALVVQLLLLRVVPVVRLVPVLPPVLLALLVVLLLALLSSITSLALPPLPQGLHTWETESNSWVSGDGFQKPHVADVTHQTYVYERTGSSLTNIHMQGDVT